MLFDDAVGGCQPHSRALPRLLGGEERLEDALARFGVHAPAGVGNRQNRIATGRNVRIEPAVRVVQLRHLRFDQQSSSVGHGIARVQAQIHEHLLKLRGIGFDSIDSGGGDFELDIFANYFVQKADQPAGNGIDVHGLRLQHLAPREGQQFPRKRRGPFRLFANP